jgi:hypothetical protein
MIALTRCTRFITRLTAILLLNGVFSAAASQQARAQELPPPHLGYGIHIAPNTQLERSLVYNLGVDWVKIYDTAQAALFPDQHILFRWDLNWPADWNQFRRDVERRARELTALKIDAVEVGNEPNLSHEWSRGPNAWEYVQMLRVAYTAIKAGNPNVIVVSAGLAPTLTTPDRKAINDLDFAREMLENGAAQWFDAFGYHPYGYNMPPEADPASAELVFRRAERMRALLEKSGVYKQVWLTEFGWLRNPAEDGVNCHDSDPDFTGFAWLRVSAEQQASYLVRAFQYADRNWPWAGPMFVWNLNWHQQSWLPQCSHQRWFSLLRLNGEPTAAYRRLQAMDRRPATYVPRLELKADAMAVEISIACLRRIELGSFSIANTGYPLPVPIRIAPLNNGQPPFIEVDKSEARAGDKIRVFVNPNGVQRPGQYPIYINVRAVVDKQPFSQNVQGYLVVSQTNINC